MQNLREMQHRVKDEVENDIKLVKASVEGSQESSKLFRQSA